MTVIVPIAYNYRRPKCYGPKSLVSDRHGQTLLEKQISILKEVYKDPKIVIVVGQDSDKIVQLTPSDVKVVENDSYTESGVVRSIALGMHNCSNDKLVVVHGDILFNKDAISSLFGTVSKVLVDDKGTIDNDKIGINFVHGRVASFSFGVNPKWGQITYLTGREFEIFRQVVTDPKSRKMNTYEILDIVVKRGGYLYGVCPKKSEIKEIGNERII